ncbi:hypothetical protein GCM10007392_27990 [Saccharospirillum salsuginis]|uniref:Uncharacterized protein n=1 Tax=Saccharospirillum salsuginis TaxID=418750 RepID=A0A918KCG4_9GAMM|nr:hypothetical protein GCM10007392_27990 [Saccharospirillum salsuginis]
MVARLVLTGMVAFGGGNERRHGKQVCLSFVAGTGVPIQGRSEPIPGGLTAAVLAADIPE